MRKYGEKRKNDALRGNRRELLSWTAFDNRKRRVPSCLEQISNKVAWLSEPVVSFPAPLPFTALILHV